MITETAKPETSTENQQTTGTPSLEQTQVNTSQSSNSQAAPTTLLEEASSSEAAKETATEQPKADAPFEEYDIEVDESSPLSQEDLDAIALTAGQYKMNKAEAQKLVETMEAKYKAGQSKAEAAHSEKIAKMREEIAKDPMFSAEKKAETFASISRAVQKFGDPDLQNLLKEPGIGDNVVLARFLNKIGQQISPDTFPGKGGNSGNIEAEDPLKTLYPSFYQGM